MHPYRTTQAPAHISADAQSRPRKLALAPRYGSHRLRSRADRQGQAPAERVCDVACFASEEDMMDWEHEGKPPRFDDIREYEVWIYDTVRSVRRIGNKSLSLTPGSLVYTDCVHPEQNVICYEPDIQAWRVKDKSFQVTA